MLLSVDGLTKVRNGTKVVNAVSFYQHAHEKLAIVGETGSGKSSLLKLIAGLLQPDGGAVFFKGENVLGPDEQLIPGHKGIGYLSQHFELLNNYRVHEILEMNNRLPDVDAEHIYEICQITHLLQRKTNALSGGEKQRIALAKVLVQSPQLVLLDEPFSNLDVPHKHTIQQVLHDVGEALRISFILVAHHATDVLPWADRMLIMQNGQVIQTGSPKELYYHPFNTYCAALLGDFNLIALSSDTQCLIRPEHINFTTEKESRLAGVVSRVDFCGPYHRVWVEVESNIVQVITHMPNFIKGDTVYLTWLQQDAHLLT